MRSGSSATSSFANRCIASTSAAAQRVSIRMLRPSVHPSFWSPSQNAAIQACPSWSLSAYAISTPIRRIRSGCCARAVSGKASVPPRRVMNSRLCIRPHALWNCQILARVTTGQCITKRPQSSASFLNRCAVCCVPSSEATLSIRSSFRIRFYIFVPRPQSARCNRDVKWWLSCCRRSERRWCGYHS